MFEEIERARKKAEEKRSRQKKEDEQRMQEADAKAVAAYKGKLVECDICAEDRPPNRMASCNSKEKHTYCFVCVKTHIETIVGDGKFVPVCMETGCKGRYPRQVLEQLLDKALVARMERLEQNADLKGIKGIEECPFCNFKAICETPSKFDCQNPECLMSSCLKCKAETHPGSSCAAYAKKKKENEGDDKGMRLRHLVEEAMSEAMMRRCPECGTPFTKDQGCNKMICPACGMMSCYVCGAPQINIMHFGPRGCPQFDATEARHDAEVKQAEKAAKEKVKRENPGVTDEDLKFCMSDKVKQDDKKRLAREDRALRGEDWHFGMPIEGEDEDEDFEEEMFGMRELGGMRNHLGRMRGPIIPFQMHDLGDPFDEDFQVNGRFPVPFMLNEGFNDGILGRGHPFDDDFQVDGRIRRGPIFLDAPPRRRRQREQPDLDGVRVAPPRANVIRQQEATFNHHAGDRMGLNRERWNRPAAEQTDPGAERIAAPVRQHTGGGQRLGRTPAVEVARAAALARPRRGS